MFDILGKASLIKIISMDIHTDPVDVPMIVELYHRLGTWDGRDKHPGAWKLISQETVTSQGRGMATSLPSTTFDPVITVTKSQRHAFYITVANGRYMQYTDAGNNNLVSGDVYASNDDLSVLVGAGKNYQFLHTQRNVVWNGAMYYAVSSSDRANDDNAVLSSSSSSSVVVESTARSLGAYCVVFMMMMHVMDAVV